MSPDIYLKSFLSKKLITFFFILLELPCINLNIEPVYHIVEQFQM